MGARRCHRVDGLGQTRWVGQDKTRQAVPLSSSHVEEHGEGEALVLHVEGQGR